MVIGKCLIFKKKTTSNRFKTSFFFKFSNCSVFSTFTFFCSAARQIKSPTVVANYKYSFWSIYNNGASMPFRSQHIAYLAQHFLISNTLNKTLHDKTKQSE